MPRTRSAGLFLRWVRAALLAAVALGAGVVAHVSAGGLLPGPVALGTVLLCCTGGAAWLLGRPASAARVVRLLVAAQTVVHGALTALAGHRGDHPSPPGKGDPTTERLSSRPAPGVVEWSGAGCGGPLRRRRRPGATTGG